jgi:hypothetical protein
MISSCSSPNNYDYNKEIVELSFYATQHDIDCWIKYCAEEKSFAVCIAGLIFSCPSLQIARQLIDQEIEWRKFLRINYG